MDTIKFISLMADNADFVYSAIAEYIAEHLQIPTTFHGDLPWQQQEQMLDSGEAQFGVICGLPYVRKADRPQPLVKLLVAPIMRGQRYGAKPIYFSDVVVRADSRFYNFADLHGASWSYNETGSQSGYNLTRYYLATQGKSAAYFSRVVEAGAHQVSLRMIIRGEIDASAIDTTVLEMELRQYPYLASQIRIIHTLGPSPIPPFVVARSCPDSLANKLRSLLLAMDKDESGRKILDMGMIDHFGVVRDHDYDIIRDMARAAEAIQWKNIDVFCEKSSPR